MYNAYVNFLISEFNFLFQNIIIFDCLCYQKLKNFRSFSEYVFQKRNSYMCCVNLYYEDNYIVLHEVLPVMLGSLIDHYIRKKFMRNDRISYILYGMILNKGSLYYVPNFMTNNLRYGHLYDNKGDLSFRMTLKDSKDDIFLMMSYKPEVPANTNDFWNRRMTKKVNKKNIAATSSSMNHHSNASGSGSGGNRKIGARKEWYDMSDGKLGVKVTNNQKRWSEQVMEYANENFNIPMSGDIVEYEKAYITLFEAFLKTTIVMDDISNKIIITPSKLFYMGLLKRVHIYFQERRKKCERAGKVFDKKLTNQSLKLLNKNMNEIFKNGNLYFAVSNRQLDYVQTEYRDMYTKVEGHKIMNAHYMLTNVKRSSTGSKQNVKALYFPQNGIPFICPLNTKEMKDAGEILTMTQFVIPSLEIKNIYDLLKSDFVKKTIDKTSCYRYVFIETFYVHDFCIEKVPGSLLRIKSICPFLSLRSFDDILLISGNGSLPMKYSVKYNTLITPYEYNNFECFKDAFANNNNMEMFSSLAMRLFKNVPLTSAQPQKLVVALNNIKGECLFGNTSPLIDKVFEYSLGTNTAIILDNHKNTTTSNMRDILKNNNRTEVDNTKFLKLSRLQSEDEKQPEITKRLFAKNKMFSKRLDERHAQTSDDIYKPEYVNYLLDIIKRFMPVEKVLTTKAGKNCRARLNDITGAEENDEVKNFFLSSTILSSPEKLQMNIFVNTNFEKSFLYDHFDNKMVYNNQLILWCGLADWEGSTNEDGIVIDKKLSEKGPVKLIHNMFSVKVLKANNFNSRVSDNKAYVKYHESNMVFGEIILFGFIKSRQRLTLHCSLKIRHKEIKFNDMSYAYVLYMKDISAFEKHVESYMVDMTPSENINNNNTKTVFGNINIKYMYVRKMDKGIKITNIHGQKGIVTNVGDLSVMKYYTKDGKCYHPQVLFSPLSIIGRTVASQIASMMNENTAINNRGYMISPMAINVHSIDNVQKASTASGTQKLDLMTMENGLLCNNLNALSLILERQCSTNDREEKLSMLLELFNTESVMLNVGKMTKYRGEQSDDDIVDSP